MKFVAMRELRINASAVLDQVAKQDMVITRNGKPAAALVRLDEELLDEFILAHHPSLIKEVDAARGEYQKKGGISHAEMKKRLNKRRG